jgi:hypothetical protein
MDLWNRIAEAGWLVLAQPEVQVQYRIHGESAVSSDFMRMRLQLEWLKTCLRARRKRQPEPNYEEFHKQWSQAGLCLRLNRTRKNVAKGLYRSGGFAVAERRHVNAAARLIASLMLAPTYASRRLFQQLYRRTK